MEERLMSEAANAQAVHVVPRVLSIAGTDPTGGAGIQADLKSIAANGGYGMAVVTALVAQNTGGVRSVHVPPVTFLREQLDAVSDDVEIEAVKIGMLADIDVIGAVREWLVRVAPPIVVLDPVMVATSGDRLLCADAEGALRDLARLAHLVTPNIPELAILADEPPATSWEETLAQAARVSRRLGVMVLAKGGHLDHGTSPDALVDARGGEVLTTMFDAPRIATTNTHGTGCSLSSALATRLVASPDAAHAVGEAKRWLSESIRGGADLEVGRGNGPISHFAGMWQRAGLDTRPTAGEIRAEWWEGIRPVRERIDALPFLVGLGDGTLDDQTFRGYLAQDALYLRDFARALATASACAHPGRAGVLGGGRGGLDHRGARAARLVARKRSAYRRGSCRRPGRPCDHGVPEPPARPVHRRVVHHSHRRPAAVLLALSGHRRTPVGRLARGTSVPIVDRGLRRRGCRHDDRGGRRLRHGCRRSRRRRGSLRDEGRVRPVGRA
jgi:hydroxymethylpyrimidine/phosphomethylpyrimidine kinase